MRDLSALGLIFFIAFICALALRVAAGAVGAGSAASYQIQQAPSD